MSFSSQTKNNLSRIMPTDRASQQTELLALLRSDGVFQKQAKMTLRFQTENAAVARKIFKLIKSLYGLPMETAVHQKKRLHKNNKYLLGLQGKKAIGLLLTDLKLSFDDRLEDPYDESLFTHEGCYRSYLRGSFLGAGSVSDPEGDYHLELTSHQASNAYFILKAMERFDLHPRISQRKRRHVIYLKGSDDIVTFLNVVGAHKKLLEFENVRILKDLRNKVNRGVNCETANLNKVVNTGVRQVEAIRRIDLQLGIEKLPPKLKEIARLRLEFPHLSLAELGKLLSPPKSKSAVNHRLKKLEEMADKIS